MQNDRLTFAAFAYALSGHQDKVLSTQKKQHGNSRKPGISLKVDVDGRSLKFEHIEKGEKKLPIIEVRGDGMFIRDIASALEDRYHSKVGADAFELIERIPILSF